jgi:hypothetical protein
MRPINRAAMRVMQLATPAARAGMAHLFFYRTRKAG